MLFRSVKRGGDRQELHEVIRTLSMEAGRRVKEEGLDNDLLTRIAADPRFGLSAGELSAHTDPAAYIGRCPSQVERFIREEVDPELAKYPAAEGMKLEV